MEMIAYSSRLDILENLDTARGARAKSLVAIVSFHLGQGPLPLCCGVWNLFE